MKRIIKFRAWDKYDKEMKPFWVIRRSQWNSGHPGLMKVGDEGGSIIDMFNAPEYVLMQFTGLTDKHGKEIYEGDVVKWLGYEVRNGKQVRLGRWMVVGQGHVAPNIVTGNYILDCYHLQNLIEQGDKSVEGIGNIYQNPELLNG